MNENLRNAEALIDVAHEHAEEGHYGAAEYTLREAQLQALIGMGQALERLSIAAEAVGRQVLPAHYLVNLGEPKEGEVK